MSLTTNYKNKNLYCIYCKEKIELGEEFYIESELAYGETITRYYHKECFFNDNE
jgi:hypothetical protein